MAEEKVTQQDTQVELLSYDPFVVVLDVLRRWYVIAAVALIAAMAIYVRTEMTYRPQYTTTTTFVVSLQESNSTVYQNLTATTNLATVFSEVLNSSLLRKLVVETPGCERFAGKIDAQAVEETNLLTMRVTDRDPRTAFLATKAIIERHHEVSEQITGNIVLEVLQQPKVPTAPSNPIRTRSNAKRAAVLAAGAALVYLVLSSAMRDTVRSTDEATKKLDCRVLGEIKHERKYRTLRTALRHKKTSILITNPLTSFSYTEKLRTIRRKIEQHLPAGGKVIMITSALENEGKSTVVVNIALALARKHKKILLIDCDMRKPALYKILGVSCQGNAVAEAVSGKAEAAEKVIPYAEGKTLDLLLGGQRARGSAELCGSEGMAKLFAWAKENYDYVLIDTPPMSAGVDAESLADLADASVLIVRQNWTEARNLQSVIDVLEAAESKFIGCILNDCWASAFSEQSSYGYGYGYGRYGKYGKYGKYGAYGAYGSTQNDNS